MTETRRNLNPLKTPGNHPWGKKCHPCPLTNLSPMSLVAQIELHNQMTFCMVPLGQETHLYLRRRSQRVLNKLRQQPNNILIVVASDAPSAFPAATAEPKSLPFVLLPTQILVKTFSSFRSLWDTGLCYHFVSSNRRRGRHSC